jgi:hypothetical protein
MMKPALPTRKRTAPVSACEGSVATINIAAAANTTAADLIVRVKLNIIASLVVALIKTNRRNLKAS